MGNFKFFQKNSHSRNTILSTGCIIKTFAAIGHTQPEGANLRADEDGRARCAEGGIGPQRVKYAFLLCEFLQR